MESSVAILYRHFGRSIRWRKTHQERPKVVLSGHTSKGIARMQWPIPLVENDAFAGGRIFVKLPTLKDTIKSGR